MNVQKLNENLRIFEIIEQDFSSNTKNIFCFTCIVLNPDSSLKKEPKSFFGGLFGYGNSCMDCFFANCRKDKLEFLRKDKL